MMDRLRDAPDDVLAKDPALARAAALLRAEEPLAPSEIRQRKVASAIRRRAEVRRLRLRLSPAIAAVVALLLLGAASARLRRAVQELFGAAEAPPAHIVPSSDPPIVPAPVVPVSPASPPPVQQVERVSAPPLAPPATARPGATSSRARTERNARPVAVPQPAPAPSIMTPPPIVAPPPAAPPPVSAKSSEPVVEEAPSLPGLDRASAEEVKLVFDAMDALRNRRDHRTAARLLDEYLARFPNGAIHEDALYLAIEAAVSAHSPRAATLGASYLERYPSGRFRRAAARARDGGTR